MRYIVPDVTIVKFRDHFDILLNESSCSGIEINCYYQQMNQRRESEEVKAYLDNKIRQAEWIRHCVAQRSKTIMLIINFNILGYFSSMPIFILEAAIMRSNRSSYALISLRLYASIITVLTYSDRYKYKSLFVPK